MTDAWMLLLDAGVPAGPTRRPPEPPLDWESVRHALGDVLEDAAALQPSQREALHAWLEALRHHWPTRWSALVGEASADLAALAAGLAPARDAADHGRFLKLRRIAIDHLARVA